MRQERANGAGLIALMVLAVSLAGPAAPTATAGEAHVYLAAYGLDSHLAGDGQVSDGSTGDRFELEETLGLDPGEVTHGLDGFVKLGGSRIEFSYSAGDYAGEETLEDDLDFNGSTFAGGLGIDSEIEIKRYKLLYGFDFGLKIVNAGFVVGAHLVDIDARVRASGGPDERERLRAPIPVVGATIGVHPISQLAIHGEVTGFSLTLSGVETRLIEVYAGLDYLFLPRFGLTAGYRHFILDAEDQDEDDAVHLTQRGVYVGLALHL